MQKLSIEAARELYKDLLENEEVRQISKWTESNSSEPTDEDDLSARALSNIDVFFQKIEVAFKEKQKK